MKKFLLLLFITFVSKCVAAQTCPSVDFDSQQRLDNFKTQNPNCKTISGRVVIYGPDITNLDGLSNITAIEGDLALINTSVTTLKGLSSLVSISGRLSILVNPLLSNSDGLENLAIITDGIDVNGNPTLTDFSGLQSLSHVGSYLRVTYNESLTSIEAFNKITFVTEYLSVGANPLLESLSGLHNISSAPSVSIGSNPKLLSLDGLRSLEKTSGYLYVGDNASLTNLQGLNKLRTVADYFAIDGNAELTTLEGMDVLESVDNFRIQNNPKLSMCATAPMCKAVRNSAAVVLTELNATGCNTREEILAMCISLPVELVSFSGDSKAEGNVLQWTTASEINNKGFEVERSTNGRLFETIGFVEGNTDSRQALNYSFTDATQQSLTYYRLKQIDWDGTSTYSRIISVKRKNENAKVYPNPSRGRLFIDTQNHNQPYIIKNSQGTTVKASSVIPANGISTTSLPNGMYFVIIGSEVFKVLMNND